MGVIAAELAKWRTKADDDAALYRDLNVNFTASDLGLTDDELDALVADYTRLFGASAPRTLRLRYERESVRRG
jgi:hypothetical protein